jgi:hypothetical protein
LVVDLLDVFGVAKDGASPADRAVGCLVFGLEGACSHARQGRRRAELNEALEVERREEEVLGFDPTDRRSKLVGEELYENDIGELLTVSRAAPFIFFPLLEDLVEARRRGLVIDDLSVVARHLERFRNEIGDVFSDKHVGVQVRGVDLFGQVYKKLISKQILQEWKQLTSTERHNASPKVARVEWYIDTRQRDGGKPTLQFDVPFGLLLLLCFFVTGLDDVAQHLLDLLDGVGFSELYRVYQIFLDNCTYI